ncbi:MAG: hypothetical protein Q4D58_12255 [Synergistaceae bacterium]|nr:hypothetical protein [Synergistaceae bacterium]
MDSSEFFMFALMAFTAAGSFAFALIMSVREFWMEQRAAEASRRAAAERVWAVK